MDESDYRGSHFRERASEWQRRLAVNESWHMPVRRFESCRSHKRKRGGDRHIDSPS